MRFFRTAIILAVVAAVAGFTYWYFEIKRKTEKQEQAEQEALLFDFGGKKVERLTLERPDERIVMVREVTGMDEEGNEEVRWKIVEPVETRGDDMTIESLISRMRQAKHEEVVYESLDKLSEYRLDEPRFSVRFTLQGETAERGADFGIRTLDKKKVFARVVGDERIVTVTAQTQAELAKSLFDVRDKRIAVFESDDLEGMIVISALGQIVLKKEEDGQWYLMPEEIEASETRVDLFTGALQWGTFVEVEAEEGENFQRYGLDKPRVLATLKLTDQPPFLFAVGDPVDEERDFYYATRSSDNMIFQVKTDTVNRLVKTEFELKDRSIFQFTDDQVTDITMKWDDKNMTFRREGDGWKLADSGEVVERGYQVDNILRGIRTAEYEKHEPLHPDDPGYTETGIRDPVYTFVLEFEDRQPLTLHLTEKNEETGRLYLTPDGGETVYLTTGYFLNNLPESREELLEL